MHISPISLQGNISSYKKTDKRLSNAQAPTARTQNNTLPSYELSFGMAKILRSNSNPECTIGRAQLEEINKYWFNTSDKNAVSIKDLVDLAKRMKGQSDAVILQYLKGNSPYKFAALSNEYAEAYTNALKLNYVPKDNPSLIRKILTTKGEHGFTWIISAACNNGTIPQIESILDLAADDPKLQYEILMQKDDDGNTAATILQTKATQQRGKVADECYSQLGLINDAIYNLATQTNAISPEESFKLLADNREALDDSNLRALEMFRKNDYQV